MEKDKTIFNSVSDFNNAYGDVEDKMLIIGDRNFNKEKFGDKVFAYIKLIEMFKRRSEFVIINDDIDYYSKFPSTIKKVFDYKKPTNKYFTKIIALTDEKQNHLIQYCKYRNIPIKIFVFTDDETKYEDRIRHYINYCMIHKADYEIVSPNKL